MLNRCWPDLLIALVIFAVCLAVYDATLTPSLSYESPDGNELATVCYVLGLAHSTGYPLYTWIGKLFTLLPIGDVAHRVNLMSATLGAAGVALLYAILRLLTNGRHRTPSRLASAFAALLFAFSPTFWSQTGIAEVYAPNVFMLTLTLLVLLLWARVEERDRQNRPAGRPWWRALLPSLRSLLLLLAFGLIFGLSLGTHMSNLGFAPAFALFILLISWRAAVSPVSVAGAGSGFALGLLQFLWLPYKAGTLTDRMMRADSPTTLRGIYKYTLGAFPQFKFAFSLFAIPDRLVIYLDLLRQQFGLWGIGLGAVGMWALLVRRSRRFFLVVGMYLAHVWFFIQYDVFDLDVFFIPAHLLYALFAGFGIYWLAEKLFALPGRRQAWRAVASVALAITLALLTASGLWTNWGANDRSGDVAINDFYENVFALLPEDAALLGRSGVFGYDMFYYRLVYDVRPDVAMPHLRAGNPRPDDLSGREVYTTVRLDDRQTSRGPWAPPPGLVSAGAWHVPVLLGGSAHSGTGLGAGSLVLYHVVDEVPEMIVAEAEPQVAVGEGAGGWVLVGYDLASGEREVVAGGALHLTLYWQAREAVQRVLMGSLLDGAALETHEPGMGNLQRYIGERRPLRDGVLVEDYWVVVPRTTQPHEAKLAVGIGHPFRPPGSEEDWETILDLGEVTISPGG
jgi:hypothetical protein